jgi:hypothetical protein
VTGIGIERNMVGDYVLPCWRESPEQRLSFFAIELPSGHGHVWLPKLDPLAWAQLADWAGVEADSPRSPSRRQLPAVFLWSSLLSRMRLCRSNAAQGSAIPFAEQGEVDVTPPPCFPRCSDNYR